MIIKFESRIEEAIDAQMRLFEVTKTSRLSHFGAIATITMKRSGPIICIYGFKSASSGPHKNSSTILLSSLY